ncbi:MAG: glycosyltransferase family 4 protein [Nitrososphaerota archaeon]
MKVALLAPVWGIAGGWSRVVEKMTPLIAEKVIVDLYLPVDSPRLNKPYNFNVKHTLPPISYHPFHPRVIKHLMKTVKDLMKGGYDLIQTYDAWPLSFVGALASQIHKDSLFIGAHGTAALAPLFNWKTRESLLWSYRICVEVFCISSFTKKFLEKLTGLSKFRVLPLDGVDYEFFSSYKKVVEKLRGRWKGRIVLTVGKLKERKGIDVSLKAFKIVKEKVRDAKYIIIGGGNIEKYRRFAEELGLEDVYFLGNVSDEELAGYYQLCDVFVLTPKRFGTDVEGFGLVYLEAGAAGKPVVASMHGGVTDVVKHMKNGLLVPENDPDSTAEAILTLLMDKELSEKLGNEGRETAMRFRWENTVDNLVKTWKEKLKKDD